MKKFLVLKLNNKLVLKFIKLIVKTTIKKITVGMVVVEPEGWCKPGYTNEDTGKKKY